MSARHNRHVRLPARHVRITLALLCAVLLASRIAGAHFHLCFDGSEPPVSLHVVDSATVHSGEHDGISHDDQDVSVGGEYLAKKQGAGSDLAILALALAFLLCFLPRNASQVPGYDRTLPARQGRAHVLPPPRGPPRIV
jgi:hypothetical protein